MKNPDISSCYNQKHQSIYWGFVSQTNTVTVTVRLSEPWSVLCSWLGLFLVCVCLWCFILIRSAFCLFHFSSVCVSHFSSTLFSFLSSLDLISVCVRSPPCARLSLSLLIKTHVFLWAVLRYWVWLLSTTVTDTRFSTFYGNKNLKTVVRLHEPGKLQ